MSGVIRVAASALRAHQMRMDVIANNFANVNSTGFKAGRVDLQDDRYIEVQLPGAAQGPGAKPDVWLGTGVIFGSRQLFTQGDVESTGVATDLAIIGQGFFQVRLPDGGLAYARSGALTTDSLGKLVTNSGYPLEPPISLPPGAWDMRVSSDGRVTAMTDKGDASVEVGRVLLANFPNPAGLQSSGYGLYAPTQASGVAVLGVPGQGGLGTILGGALERSNVDLVGEMTAMVEAQRAYQISVKAVQTLIEMAQAAENMQRQ